MADMNCAISGWGVGSGRDHLPCDQQRRLDLVAVCRCRQPADGDAWRVQDGLLCRRWRAVPRLRHFRQLADRSEPVPEYVAKGASLGLGCLGPPCSTPCSVRSLCARLQASPAPRSRWPIAATRRGRPAPSAPASLARACLATPAPQPAPALAPRRSPEPGAPSPLAAAVCCPPMRRSHQCQISHARLGAGEGANSGHLHGCGLHRQRCHSGVVPQHPGRHQCSGHVRCWAVRPAAAPVPAQRLLEHHRGREPVLLYVSCV